MKRAVVCILCLAIVFATLAPTVAFADENDEAYRTVSDFLESCPSRHTAEEQRAAAEYLQEKFQSIFERYDVNSSVRIQEFETSVQSCNVVAELNVGKSVGIIIGAHYDSVGEGASDNATGIATLLLTAERLCENKENLPCNVIFVAFGAEEQGLCGSKYFVENADLTDLLLMINFDCVGNGDNLYLMCENKPTQLANLFLQHSGKIVEKPYAKGTLSYDLYGYGYYELVQGNDATSFRLKGVPTALFFSGTYDATFWGYRESSDPDKCVMNTERDTFENLVANGDFASKIQETVNCVCNTVLSEKFAYVAANSRNELAPTGAIVRLLPIAVTLCVVCAIALFCVLHYRKLKRASLGKVNTKKL